jgi:uncharacterized protein (TIGR02996 family)
MAGSTSGFRPSRSEFGFPVSDTDILYRAVLDNPDDDTLRLVYADALEESGDPRRGAFVREQVALSRVPEYDPLWVRVRAHGRTFDPLWTEGLDLPDGIDWAPVPFRRGLPGAIHAADAAAFVAHADELFARYPIEALELVRIRPRDTRDFPACAWLERLTALSLVQGAGGQTVGRLLASPHLTRLRELRVGPQLTTPSTVAAVVGSAVFGRLTALGVRSERDGGPLVNELARLAKPPPLKSLDLTGNRLSADDLEQLVASRAAAGVRDLDLSDNNLGAAGAAALARGTLPALRSLRLVGTRPQEDGVHALTAAGFFTALRSLSLGGNSLGPGAAVAIAHPPGAALQLRVLDLRENRIGDRGAAALAGSPHLPHLIELDLAESQVRDAGAAALADSPHLDGLLYLNLFGNGISEPTADCLRERFGDRVFL